MKNILTGLVFPGADIDAEIEVWQSRDSLYMDPNYDGPVTDDEIREVVDMQHRILPLAVRRAWHDLILSGATLVVAPLFFGLSTGVTPDWYAKVFGGPLMIITMIWWVRARHLLPLPRMAHEPAGEGASLMTVVRRNEGCVKTHLQMHRLITVGRTAGGVWLVTCCVGFLSGWFGWSDVPNVLLVAGPVSLIILALIYALLRRAWRGADTWLTRHSPNDDLPYMTFWARITEILVISTYWHMRVETTLTTDGRAYVTVYTECEWEGLGDAVGRDVLQFELEAFCRTLNSVAAAATPYADTIPWVMWGNTVSGTVFTPVATDTGLGWHVEYPGVDAGAIDSILVDDLALFASVASGNDTAGCAFRASTRGYDVNREPPSPLAPALLLPGARMRFVLRLPGEWREHNAAEDGEDGALAWFIGTDSQPINARTTLPAEPAAFGARAHAE